MVPMAMVVLAMLVLAMLAMLAMLDTPMPMVPTATLDKKFFFYFYNSIQKLFIIQELISR